MSNVYEERATMIAAGELQSFVPFGREHCKNHPNAVNLQLRQLQPASELWSSDGAAGLVGSLQEVTLHERERVRTRGISQFSGQWSSVLVGDFQARVCSLLGWNRKTCTELSLTHQVACMTHCIHISNVFVCACVNVCTCRNAGC